MYFYPPNEEGRRGHRREESLVTTRCDNGSKKKKREKNEKINSLEQGSLLGRISGTGFEGRCIGGSMATPNLRGLRVFD